MQNNIGNSDLKSFAVFINSKVARPNTTQKSSVTIPFTANLADHEPMKTFKFSFIDMLFTNIFYNIRPKAQTLKYVDLWAAGRGVAATYTVKTVVIPSGTYDFNTLATYLSTTGVMNQDDIVFTSGAETVQVFPGFGSFTNTNLAPIVDACIPAIEQGKLLFQTPTLGDFYQVEETASPLSFTAPSPSYIYAGKYLIEDEDTYGLMRVLGFSNSSTKAPSIPGTPFFGFGTSIQYRTNTATVGLLIYEYSFDGIIWGTDYADPAPPAASVNANVLTTLTPSTVTDLSGLDELYVHCPQFRTQYLSSSNKYPIAPNDVIAVIPINVPFGNKMSWVPDFQLTSYLKNTNITQLDFYLTNSNNELLDFNGIDWSMTLFCEEEIDMSRLQQENGGTFPTSLQLQANTNAGDYMQERQQRRRRNPVN